MLKNCLTNRLSLLLQLFTSAKWCTLILCFALSITYAVLPFFLYLIDYRDSSYLVLPALTLLAVVSLSLGASIPYFDAIFDGRSPKLVIGPTIFNFLLWVFFVSFVFFVLLTAPKIPLIAAMQGADIESVTVLREQFFKAREGWQSSLVYINGVISGSIIPFSLALLFLYGSRLRWVALIFFLIFSLSFVEKAFFFKAALPLLYLIAQGHAKTRLSSSGLLIGSIILLFLITFFSGSGSLERAFSDPFFSVNYIPEGAFDHLIWRSIAIPMLTALDAIQLFNDQFYGQYFGGATSSFVSTIIGVDRIEFERLVFAFQWGQNETETGSANSVYITEAYTNFGLFGVFFISLFIGLCMRFFSISHDEAFRSLWPVFAFGIYTSGFLGMLFSNGFLFLFILAAFVRVKHIENFK